MKSTMQQSLSNKAKDVLREYQTAQLSFKNCLKKKITRQTKYVDNSLTDEQVDDISSDPQVLITLFFFKKL